MDNRQTQIRKAQILRSLHDHRTRPLLLANAWDAISARLFAEAGFEAIASAGLAWALGYRGGEQVRRDDMRAVTPRIVRAAAVPVTADIQAGCGGTPEALDGAVNVGLHSDSLGVDDSSAPGSRVSAAPSARSTTSRDS